MVRSFDFILAQGPQLIKVIAGISVQGAFRKLHLLYTKTTLMDFPEIWIDQDDSKLLKNVQNHF